MSVCGALRYADLRRAKRVLVRATEINYDGAHARGRWRRPAAARAQKRRRRNVVTLRRRPDATPFQIPASLMNGVMMTPTTPGAESSSILTPSQ